MYKVSIIVPVYNVEKYLNRCIDSILSQSYDNFELILIDDGSSDSSGKICDSYEKYPNVIVKHINNNGVSNARNIGLSIASGEYILFVDSDDYIDINMVAELVKGIENVDMSICGYNIISESGDVLNVKIPPKKIGKQMFTGEIAIQLYDSAMLYAIWNKLYKKEVLDDLMFIKNCSFGEDLLFNISYFNKVKKGVCIIDRPLYNYVISQNSITRQNSIRERKNLFIEENANTKEQLITFLDGFNENLNYTQIYIEYFMETKNEVFLLEKDYTKKWFALDFTKKAAKNINKADIRTKILAFCVRHNFIMLARFIIQLKVKVGECKWRKK